MMDGVTAGEGYQTPTYGHAARTKRELVDAYLAAETLKRRLDAEQYQILAELDTMPEDGTIGGRNTVEIVADAARLNKKDVRARLRIARDVTGPVAYTGQILTPTLEHVADVVHNGTIGIDHITVIRRFFKHLPRAVRDDARTFAEQQLAGWATEYRPDELAKLADKLLLVLDPDGTLDDDVDRARKRHLTLHKQGPDLMVSGSFCLTPEAAAYLEQYLAKFARKGMCNPSDGEPTIHGDPDDAAITADDRTYGQRCHDALVAMMRDTFMSGRLGQHRGLPVTVVLTADISALDPASGTPQIARTGGGLVIPITDVLRLAGHAQHYLATIYGDAVPISLHHGRDQRIASDGQRLMLHATDRGCTFPGCDRGAIHSQVHHAVTDWVDGGLTNIEDLANACDVHHPLAGNGPGKWRTRKNGFGYTEWIPPKCVDPLQRPQVNHFHHPERRVARNAA